MTAITADAADGTVQLATVRERHYKVPIVLALATVLLGALFIFAPRSGTSTFRLTDEAVDEPPKRLAVALERARIAPERFAVRRPGETFDVPSPA
mgnify:CR=1 FL=1